MNERLARLAELKDGWFGGDGKAVSKEAVKKAELLLKPHIYATPEGGLQIETEDYDIVIGPDGSVEVVR